VVLIESGGLPRGWSFEGLTRLNFVGILHALSRLVADDLQGEGPALYEALERNQGSRWVDVLVKGGQVWQPGGGPPYRADVGFDRLDRDPVSASCVPPENPGPSRVREVGDGRHLGSARLVEAAGRLVVPAFAASLDGLSASDWLDADAATRLGWLGVARLRWQVAPSDVAPARALARRIAGPGRPTVEVVDAGEPACLLELKGRPRSPESSRLEDVLEALTLGGWQDKMGGRSFGAALGALTRCTDGPPQPPSLAPDRPASLLVLQPRGVSPDEAGALSLSGARGPGEPGLEIVAVFIDGREPAHGE
jgi:hypothetical protein